MNKILRMYDTYIFDHGSIYIRPCELGVRLEERDYDDVIQCIFESSEQVILDIFETRYGITAPEIKS